MDQPVPSTIYDNPQLQSARSAYEGAERQATQAESSSISLPTMLKEALNKKFSADNPLVQGRERALENYLTVNESAPLDVTHRSAGGRSDVVYSPLEQSSLIGARRAAATAPLSTANYLLGMAEGGIADVVDSTSRAGQAEVSRLKGNAQLKRQTYQDIFSEIAARAAEEQQRRDNEYRERELEESIRQFNVGQSSKNSGGFDLSSLLSLFNGGDVLGLDAFEEEEPKKKTEPIKAGKPITKAQVPTANKTKIPAAKPKTNLSSNSNAQRLNLLGLPY